MENRKPFLFFLLFLLFSSFFSFKSPPLAHASGEIYYLKAEGIINPVMAEFIGKSLIAASNEKAEAFIIQLDTPGGLDLSMRVIIKDLLSSDVPVIVYVAPAGSRAASAGVFITYAANIAAMAPGTNIGSAHPVAMGGGKIDETMAKKVENDAVAYIRGIAAKRHRNVDWADKAVRESVNVTAEDALKMNVINLIAVSRDDLISKLDGMKVELPAGTKILKTKGASVKEVEMNLRARILKTISEPNIAYILMMIGIVGLYFELSNPGLVFPGVIGAICLVLAFYAFQTLSVNYAGLLLIGLAIIFFIAEIKITSYGLLSVAGIISLILGSLMLFNSPLPFLRLSIWVILPTIIVMTAIILGTMYYAIKIHRRKPVSGREGMIGAEGMASEDIDPDREGKVFVEGEYWNATTDAPLKKGDKVKVVEVKGLRLKVSKIL